MLKPRSFGDPDIKTPDYMTLNQLITLKPEVFVIPVTIADVEYKIDFREVLRFKSFNEASDKDINEELERIASYRFTILAALAEVIERQKTLSREYSTWFMKESNNVLNRPNQLPLKMTDKQLQASIFRSATNLEYFNKHNRELENLRRQGRMLSGLNEILSQRNETLRSIGRRRLDFKKGTGYENAT